MIILDYSLESGAWGLCCSKDLCCFIYLCDIKTGFSVVFPGHWARIENLL